MCGWRDLYWKLAKDNNIRMRAFRNLADMWHRGEDDYEVHRMAKRIDDWLREILGSHADEYDLSTVARYLYDCEKPHIMLPKAGLNRYFKGKSCCPTITLIFKI